MFSFFSKKKHDSESPTEEVIQGPAVEQKGNNGDDFIFIEKKEDSPVQPSQGVYPPVPGFGYHAAYPSTIGTVGNLTPIPYVQGIPFQLAPQLCTDSTFEMTQMEVDGILAIMTRQMSIEEQDDYNFTLERSIQNECY